MKQSELFFSAIAVPLDVAAMLAAAVVSYQIRFHPQIRGIRPVIFELPFRAYVWWAVLAAVAGTLVFALAGLYRITPNRRFGEEFPKILLACSTVTALVVGVMFFTRNLFESRFIILMAWVFGIALTLAVRGTLRRLQRRLYQFGIGVHRVVLIGSSSVADDLRQEFAERPQRGFRVVAQFADFNANAARALTQLAHAGTIDEVIQVGANLDRRQTLDLVELLQARHLGYAYTADLLGTKVANFQVAIHAGIPLVEVRRTRLDGWGRIWKRMFDLVGALGLIVVTAPVMVGVGLAILIDSGRPIFFSSWRVGERGRRFRFLKFRSMIPGSHQLRYDPAFAAEQENLRAGSPMIKFKNDPRVTRAGRFLRRWSLDELPQIFLVGLGTMSLVGPRPHEVEEVARYGQSQREPLLVKPGLTGLAQVSGRSDLNFDDEVKLDSFYVQNWSPWLDLRILLQTPAAVLRRRQAE